PTDFAATLMLTSSGTTKRLDRLEAAGHITREPDPSDRRGGLITLTPKGRRLGDKTSETHMANEERILSGLTPAARRPPPRPPRPPRGGDAPPAAGRRAEPRGRS